MSRLNRSGVMISVAGLIALVGCSGSTAPSPVQLDPLVMTYRLNGGVPHTVPTGGTWSPRVLSVTGATDSWSTDAVTLHVGGFYGPGTYQLNGGQPPLHSTAGFSLGLFLDSYGTINGGWGQVIVARRRCPTDDFSGFTDAPTGVMSCEFKGSFQFTAFSQKGEKVDVDGTFVVFPSRDPTDR